MNDDAANATSSPRSNSPKGEGPWCWLAKAALDRINLCATGASNRQVLAYVALCWIASNKESSQFIVVQHEIARKAGLSTKTLRVALKELEQAGLIATKQRHDPSNPKELLPSEYTILSVATLKKGRNPAPQGVGKELPKGLGNECPRGREKEARDKFPSSEEQEEGCATSAYPSSKKKGLKRSARSRRSRSLPLEAERRGAGGADHSSTSQGSGFGLESDQEWLARKGGAV